jgi:thiol:disulfide interchange protein DsbC
VNARWSTLWLGCVLLAAQAAQAGALSKEELAAKLNGVDASQIADSPLAGFYQVAVGTQVAYVSTDGRYVLEGDLYDLQDSVNLTENARAEERVQLLSAVDRDSMIIFAPKNGEVKHRVTVFTDVDCGYCRQFHRDIDKVTALGIEVDYLSFPRTGPNTESWTKAEHVWCAKDRKSALTEAKLGGAVPDATCASPPVEAEYNLGHLVGVQGTPAIFAENGQMLGGYLTPKQLLDSLEKVGQ